MKFIKIHRFYIILLSFFLIIITLIGLYISNYIINDKLHDVLYSDYETKINQVKNIFDNSYRNLNINIDHTLYNSINNNKNINLKEVFDQIIKNKINSNIFYTMILDNDIIFQSDLIYTEEMIKNFKKIIDQHSNNIGIFFINNKFYWLIKRQFKYINDKINLICIEEISKETELIKNLHIINVHMLIEDNNQQIDYFSKEIIKQNFNFAVKNSYNQTFQIQFHNKSFTNFIVNISKIFIYYVLFINILAILFVAINYIGLIIPIDNLINNIDSINIHKFETLNCINFERFNEVYKLCISFNNLIKYFYSQEKQYKQILESSYDVIWQSDSNLHFKYVTPSSFNMFNLKPKDFLIAVNNPNTFNNIFTKEHYTFLLDTINLFKNNKLKTPIIFENKQYFIQLDRWKWVSNTINIFKDTKNEKYLVGIIRDIDDRKKSEIALIESEKKYRLFVQNFKGILFKAVVKKGPVFIHGIVKEITGYTEDEFLSGKITWRKVIHPDDLENNLISLKKLIKKDNNSDERIYRIMHKNGSYKWVREVIHNIHLDNIHYLQGIIIDIDKQKRLEEILQQTKKISYLGTMAAGIAHEINNPLTGILQYSELILDDQEKDCENYNVMKEIIVNCNRIAKIIKTLLIYSRSGSEKTPNLINYIIDKSFQYTYDRLNRYNITYTFDNSIDYTILCDSNLIEQIFINLINNSIDAINESERLDGIINITIKHIFDKIEITVYDNGIGIDKKNINKIFDPFYTTKEPGKGTGLGMSLAYSFISEHGGNIKVKSIKFKQTEFIITFPIYRQT